MMEENKIPQEIEDLRKALSEFMSKKGTAIGFFASAEWEDQICMVVNGNRDKLVNMITNAYFQSKPMCEILNDVMIAINNELETRKNVAMSNVFQLPVVIDKSKLS